MSAPAAIVLDDIETRFGQRVIHQHLNLTVQQGGVLALGGACGWGRMWASSSPPWRAPR